MISEKIIKYSKIIIIIAIFLTIVGVNVFISIPKESNPDVKMPVINVFVQMHGISSEDAERMIVRPMEKKLKGVQNIKNVYGRAGNGYGRVSIEFDAGFDSSKALQSVKDKISEAKVDMPDGIKDPIIKEIDHSKFPVFSVALFGETSDENLIYAARDLKKKIESLPNILEVNISGDRTDEIEVIIQPNVFEKHKLTHSNISSLVNSQNNLISSGYLSLNGSAAQIDSNSIIKTVDDILKSPIVFQNKTSLALKDIGYVKKSFKEPNSLAFVENSPAVIIDVSKRYGANTIETIKKIKNLIEKEKDSLEKNSIKIKYSRDTSKDILESLSDLGNNVIFAIILVVIVVISQLGIRQGVLVGMSIPISFFIGILCLSLFGYTLNMIVLFALILSSGMIVDASTIVVEYADKLIAKGVHYKSAYIQASSRMSIPVLSATLTTVVVYIPLLLWPGVMGQYMKYIPITIILVLSASILSALVFIPVFGAACCKQTKSDEKRHEKEKVFSELSETGDVLSLGGFTGKYINLLNKIINYPKKAIFFTVILLITSFVLFKFLGKGTSFFPNIETSSIRVVAHSAGNYSLEKRAEIMKEVAGFTYLVRDEVKTFFVKIIGVSGPENNTYSDDTIGVVEIDLIDWNKRRPAKEISQDIIDSFQGYFGAKIEVLLDEAGPNSGDKDIEIQVSSESVDKLKIAFDSVFEYFENLEGIKDLTTSKSFPIYKIDLNFDKEKAAKYGISTQEFGNFIKMCTNGFLVSKFRPDYSDETVDILLKFPQEYCDIHSISELSIYTNDSRSVKVGSIANLALKQDIPIIKKINGGITFRILANAKTGYTSNERTGVIKKWLESQTFDKDVKVKFSGQQDDQAETSSFLLNAFLIAIFVKMLILIAQFNSIYYGFVTMSAIIFSIIGILLGLVVTQNTFGIVMGGIGIIALAGVVVSNNIILIDTYQRFIQSGMDIRSAILRSCSQRIRPILMTSCTTVIGLVPMIYNFSIDFLDMKFVLGSPSGAWWQQLSTTIGGGLAFSTLCTLFLTPCFLILYTPEIHSKKEKTIDKIKKSIE